MTNDTVTSDTVTEWVPPGREVTLSPNHPITLSPPDGAPPGPTLPPLRDWAEMPVVDFFVERSAEVAQLTAWLTAAATGGVRAQLISLLGMGGMGKTTLAAVEALLQTVEGRLLQVDEGAYQQTAHALQEQLAAVAPATYQAALAAGRAATVEQATALAMQEETLAPPAKANRHAK